MAHTGDEVINFLKQAVNKIEELQVQTALGKAELSDKFEEIKKEAKEKISDIKNEVYKEITEDKSEFNHAKAKVEHLEVQLALGKAETEDLLKEQKKNFKAAISDIKNILSKD